MNLSLYFIFHIIIITHIRQKPVRGQAMELLVSGIINNHTDRRNRGAEK